MSYASANLSSKGNVRLDVIQQGATARERPFPSGVEYEHEKEFVPRADSVRPTSHANFSWLFLCRLYLPLVTNVKSNPCGGNSSRKAHRCDLIARWERCAATESGARRSGRCRQQRIRVKIMRWERRSESSTRELGGGFPETGDDVRKGWQV